jgi:hypothetical protein
MYEKEQKERFCEFFTQQWIEDTDYLSYSCLSTPFTPVSVGPPAGDKQNRPTFLGRNKENAIN